VSFAFAARLTARYTVERLIFSSSAISDVVYSPASYSATTCSSRAGLSLGDLPFKRPLILAVRNPSTVLPRTNAASKSATTANTAPRRCLWRREPSGRGDQDR